LNYARNLRSAN